MTAHDDPHSGELRGAIWWIALLFSAFQVVTAAFSPLSSQVVRAVHVGFVLLMVFLLMPGFRGHAAGRWLGWVLGLAVAYKTWPLLGLPAPRYWPRAARCTWPMKHSAKLGRSRPRWRHKRRSRIAQASSSLSTCSPSGRL